MTGTTHYFLVMLPFELFGAPQVVLRSVNHAPRFKRLRHKPCGENRRECPGHC